MKRQRRDETPETILSDWRKRADALVTMTGTAETLRDETGAVLGEMYHRPDTSEFDKQAIARVWERTQSIATVAEKAGAAIKASTAVHQRLVECWQQVTCELDALQAAVRRGDRTNDLVRALVDGEYYSATADLHGDVMKGIQQLTGVRHWPAALALVTALLSPEESLLTDDELDALRSLVTGVMLRMEAEEALAG